MTSPKSDQLVSFRRQCQMAVELELPLIVHSREAEEDTIAILKEEVLCFVFFFPVLFSVFCFHMVFL
jgi:Tat protein secretion system quality control protein TatD with DNase activity